MHNNMKQSHFLDAGKSFCCNKTISRCYKATHMDR